MITLSIVERHYEGDSVVAYTLKDVVGTVRKIDARILKQKMREGKVCLLGYKLTSNNRIVKTKETESTESKYDEYERYIMKQKALGVNNSDFVISDGVIKKYRGNSSIVTLPPVRAVGVDSFHHRFGLDKVNIPASIEEIGKSAFASSSVSDIVFKSNKNIKIDELAFYATYLKSLTLPEEIKEIPKMMCYRCSKLSDISLGNNLIKIGYEAFAETALTSIKLPDTLEQIDNAAFLGTRELKRIEIPDSVRILGKGVFEGSGIEYAYVGASLEDIAGITCAPNLQKIDISPNNTKLVKKNGIIYNKAEAKIVWIDRGMDCKDLIIPTSITSIGEYAFAECTFGNVKIPNSVTKISKGAFLGAKMKNLECEATDIATTAFKMAEMEDVKIINAGTISGQAFMKAKMKSLVIQGAKTIYSNAFAEIEADKALITVDTLDRFTFYRSKIDKVYVDTARIRTGAFELVTMSQLVLGENVEIIEDSAFYHNKNLRILTMRGNKIRQVWRYAFARTALQEIKFNNTLEKLGDGAFRDCKYLKKVYVGKDTNVHFDALRYSNNAELLRY